MRSPGVAARRTRAAFGRVGAAARKRIGWTITDQVLSAGTNFALSVLVARSVSSEVFGAFSIAYVTYLLWRGLTWSACAEPFMIRSGPLPDDEARPQIHNLLGAAAGLGLAATVLTGGAGLAVGGDVGSALLALAVVLSPLLVQEAVRSAFLGRAAPQRATLNDAIWGVSQLVAVTAVLAAGFEGAAPLLLAWGGSAAIAALVGLLQLRVVPDPRRSVAWLNDHRTLSPWLSIEFLLTRGSSQVTIYVLGWVSSLTAVASLRAAQVFVGPLNVLFQAAQVSLVYEGSRVRDASPRRLLRACTMASVVLGGLTLAFGGALWLLPDSVGEALVGDNWDSAHRLLPILAVGAAARGVAIGATAGSRALGEAFDLLATRAVVAPVSIISGVGGAVFFGASGAAWSILLTSVLTALLYWRQFRRQIAEVRLEASPMGATP